MVGNSPLSLSAEPVAYGAMAQYPASEKLKQQFTITSRFGDVLKLYSESNDGSMMFVPRAVCPVGDNDKRVDGYPAKFTSKFVPRNDEQARVVPEIIALLKKGESFIFDAPTGFGKCHGRGTKVLMFGGGMKAVEDVVAGDRLLGPDGAPRTVLNTVKGVGPMYRVTPRQGRPYTCNDVHVLSLKRSDRKGEIVNIEVKDYLASSATFKHVAKAWSAPAQYEASAPTHIPPRVLGLLLGDGSVKNRVALTVADQELADEWSEFVTSRGGTLRTETKPGANCSTYIAHFGGRNKPNPLIDDLRALKLFGRSSGNKFIPSRYLFVREDDRLQLLSGLLDTDGHLVKGTVFEFCSKSKRLARQVEWLARSVGMAASFRVKPVNGVAYYRVFIAGGTDRVPTKLPRKQAKPRTQKKDPCVCAFKVEPIGDDEFFGFELDGDRLYLLSDCTVTHNTVVFSAVAAAIGVTTLVVCTKDDLVKQARARFLQHTDLKPEDIGLIQQDRCDVFGKKVVIASLQSLAIPGRYPVGIRAYFGLVIFDEVHRLGADTFSYVAGLFPARLRLGVSATVNRIDGKEVVFQAHIGPVRVKAKGIPMVPKVLRYSTNWQVPRWKVNGQIQKMPHTPGKCGHILKYLCKDPARNKLILHLIESAYRNKRRHVVFSHLTEHLEVLALAARKVGVDPSDIGTYYGSMTQKRLEIASTKRLIFATPQKMGEGTDIPWLDCCTLATPMANVEQIAGRVLRDYEGKPQPVIFDLLDDDSNVFLGYAKKRARYYAKLGAEIRMMSVG